jgi:cytidylate kinase
VARRTGGSTRQAAVDIRRRDADRQHYLQRYYKSDMNDPCSYDIQINTGTVSLDAAAELVLQLIRPDALQQ